MAICRCIYINFRSESWHLENKTTTKYSSRPCEILKPLDITPFYKLCHLFRYLDYILHLIGPTSLIRVFITVKDD